MPFEDDNMYLNTVHTSKSIFIIAILMMACQSLYCQNDIVTTGGSSLFSTTGVIEYTIGQVFCEQDLGATALSVSEGVQQPFIEQPPTECDTTFLESEITTCDSMVWHGRILNSSGTYKHLAIGHNECDSIFILNLNIRYSANSYDSAEASRHFFWQGSNYTQSGNYTYMIRDVAASGCDSILHLHLALLNDAPIPHIRCHDRRLLVVDHYPEGEEGPRADYTAYRWFRNGQLIATATSDFYVEFVDGVHQNLSGCFYVEVSAGNGFWVKSNIICIEPGKQASEPATMLIHPNPTTPKYIITITLNNIDEYDTLELYDIHGRLLKKEQAHNGDNYIIAPDNSGTYSVVFRGQQNTIVKKIIVH